MRTGAVIVAAGLSSRMKSFKPLLQLAGSTVIRTAIETLVAANVSPIIVVTGRDADLLQRHLVNLPVQCIYNKDYATTDMFFSAKLGMKQIRTLCDRFFFLPVDVPLFSKRSLLTMMGYFDYSRSEILVPSYKGQEGHPVLMDAMQIDELLKDSGEQGLKGALERLTSHKEVLELPDAGTIMDADKPEEYQQLKRYAANMAQADPLTLQLDVTILRKEPFFNKTFARLLRAVERTQSIRQACLLQHISYSSGWKQIKMAESQLGFRLVYSQQGGQKGGQTHLTEQGSEFLNTYTSYHLELERLGETLFRDRFQQFLELEEAK